MLGKTRSPRGRIRRCDFVATGHCVPIGQCKCGMLDTFLAAAAASQLTWSRTKHASKKANKQTSKQASKQESKQANKQTSKQARRQAGRQASKQAQQNFERKGGNDLKDWSSGTCNLPWRQRSSPAPASGRRAQTSDVKLPAYGSLHALDGCDIRDRTTK